jgi:hypothetical protein
MSVYDPGGGMYICGIPKNRAEFSKLVDFEQALFGDRALSPEASFELFKKRPEIYTAVVCPQGSVAAYLTTYPLQPKYAEALIEGDITEPELTPDMLLTRHDNLEGSCIYIGSAVVDKKLDPILKSILLISLAQFHVRQLQADAIRRFSVIMTTVSKEGGRLANWIGAEKLNDGANRKDGLDVYGRTITQGFIYQACAVVERFFDNKFVHIDFPSRPPGDFDLLGVEAGHAHAAKADDLERNGTTTLR